MDPLIKHVRKTLAHLNVLFPTPEQLKLSDLRCGSRRLPRVVGEGRLKKKAASSSCTLIGGRGGPFKVVPSSQFPRRMVLHLLACAVSPTFAALLLHIQSRKVDF